MSVFEEFGLAIVVEVGILIWTCIVEHLELSLVFYRQKMCIYTRAVSLLAPFLGWIREVDTWAIV